MLFNTIHVCNTHRYGDTSLWRTATNNIILEMLNVQHSVIVVKLHVLPIVIHSYRYYCLSQLLCTYYQMYRYSWVYFILSINYCMYWCMYNHMYTMKNMYYVCVFFLQKLVFMLRVYDVIAQKLAEWPTYVLCVSYR